MPDDILIDVKQASYSYGGQAAVCGLDLQLRRGRVTGLLGSNGAGKSTTLRLLSGNLLADEGSVHIAGLDAARHTRRIRRHIGYLPEVPPLYPDLRVAEALDHAARLQGLRGAALRQAVARAIERCRLGDVRRRLIGRLSKGYRQRTGIAQTIIHDPAVILLDEPSSGLDPLQNIALRELIRELGSDHAVLLSSHILADIEAACDEALIMHDGRIVHHQKIGAGEGYTAGFAGPPPLQDLASLPGVTGVEAVDERRAHLACPEAAQADMLTALIRASAANGWPLTELLPARSGLEQVFVRQLSQRDTGPEPHPC